jgi:hypothetical protein
MTTLVNWLRTPAHDLGLALIAAGLGLVVFTIQIWN